MLRESHTTARLTPAVAKASGLTSARARFADVIVDATAWANSRSNVSANQGASAFGNDPQTFNRITSNCAADFRANQAIVPGQHSPAAGGVRAPLRAISRANFLG